MLTSEILMAVFFVILVCGSLGFGAWLIIDTLREHWELQDEVRKRIKEYKKENGYPTQVDES